MDHPSDATMRAYLRGELAGDERDSLEQHVEGCDKCREARQRLESEETSTRDFVLVDGMDVIPTATNPRFRILRPHAKGGLGEVFIAQDEELHREVALKEIQDRHANNPESRARFLLEAEITGGLEHPGIVPVYGLGHYPDGRPFYAMRFIRGGSFQAAIARVHQLKARHHADGERELRHLVRRLYDVCNTIAYAHSRGVLHRDLKPANIMLGDYGETTVVDWGLAKLMERKDIAAAATGESMLLPKSASPGSHTRAGSTIGTPAYMSPEQAAGQPDRLGPASDVYSLGVTLYCLLTGQPPFTDNDEANVLRKVQRGDFPMPHEIHSGVPLALEAVCLKAMSLRPQDRYMSATDLAADIERWLDGNPVSAWPEPLILSGHNADVRAVTFCPDGKRLASASDDATVRLWDLEDVQKPLVIRLLGFPREALALSFSPDGKWLAGASRDHGVRLWDGAKGREPLVLKGHMGGVVAVAFSPDGKKLASASDDGKIALWDLDYLRRIKVEAESVPLDTTERSWQVKPLVLDGHRHVVVALAFNRNGKRLASASFDGTVRLWDVDNGKEELVLTEHTFGVLAVALSPDGKTLAGANLYGAVRLWDLDNGKESLVLKGHTEAVLAMAFTPDGKQLATASHDETVRCWEINTAIATLAFKGHSDRVHAIAFNKDGSRLASASADSTVRVWTLPRG